MGTETQRQTLYRERLSKLEVSTGSLCLDSIKLHESGEGKIVGVKGDGGYQENMTS